MISRSASMLLESYAVATGKRGSILEAAAEVPENVGRQQCITDPPCRIRSHPAYAVGDPRLEAPIAHRQHAFHRRAATELVTTGVTGRRL